MAPVFIQLPEWLRTLWGMAPNIARDAQKHAYRGQEEFESRWPRPKRVEFVGGRYIVTHLATDGSVSAKIDEAKQYQAMYEVWMSRNEEVKL